MKSPRCYGLIPAAGSGTRMGAGTPKQYLELDGRPMLWHAIAALLGSEAVLRVFVVIDAADADWGRHDWSAFGERVAPVRCGGATRAESVRNGLRAMRGDVDGEDWVLVHDAARPCLSSRQLSSLLGEVSEDPVGGLLAAPVSDTLKRADSAGRVAETVPRENLWAAQTPQMFRHRTLLEALERRSDVTDEAQAIEAIGLAPRLVRSDASNLKVTYPHDREIAEWILRRRREEA